MDIQVFTYCPGIGQVEVPAALISFCERLQSDDPYLYVGLVQELGLLAIMRHDPWNQPEPVMLKLITDDNGRFRLPDERDIRDIKEADLSKSENSYQNYNAAREKSEAKKEQAFQEWNEEMAKEATDRLKHERPDLVHAPKVSMHVSKREKKEK